MNEYPFSIPHLPRCFWYLAYQHLRRFGVGTCAWAVIFCFATSVCAGADVLLVDRSMMQNRKQFIVTIFEFSNL